MDKEKEQLLRKALWAYGNYDLMVLESHVIYEGNPPEPFDEVAREVKFGLHHFGNLKWITPLLYPISSLTEEIEHPVTGEKIVPIEELAKVAEGYLDDDLFLEASLDFKNKGCLDDFHFIDWIDQLNQKQRFSFKAGDFSRCWIMNDSKFGGISFVPLNNQ